MMLLAVTPERAFAEEAEWIEALLQCGFDYVHLRHPEADEQVFRAILDRLSESARRRIKVHSHFHLVAEYGLGGVHLNHRHPTWEGDGLRSRSCHSLGELADAAEYEYVTLSPIFDSISKQGYGSAFRLESLKGNLPAPNVIALGGICREHLPLLAEAGFAGAMMCGALPSLDELKKHNTL